MVKEDIILVFRADDGKNEVLLNPRPAPLDGREIPLPDFAGPSLGTKYFSPYVAIQAMTSRGCYRNKCSFCHHSAIGMDFRPIDGPRLVQALITFGFPTEAEATQTVGAFVAGAAPST